MGLRIAVGFSNFLFSEGLKQLIEEETDSIVVGIFHTINDSMSDLKEILKLNPDLIIADLNLKYNYIPGFPEELIANESPKLLLIGDKDMWFLSDRNMKELISRGIVGILPTGTDINLLKKAIKSLEDGELWIDRHTMLKLFSAMKEQSKQITLAKREREIVFHICRGYRNKEIAQKLNISEQTVKSHCNRIYRKLGVSDRLQLALYSYKFWPYNM